MKLAKMKPIVRSGGYANPSRRTGTIRLLVDLKRMRRERGITIRQAGAALGISSGIVCQIENGCSPSIESALRFAAFVDVPVEKIWALKPQRNGKGK